MFARRSDPIHEGGIHDAATTTETIKGPSLARGPAWIVGLVLSVAGLALFFRAPGTPLGTAGFPDGTATGGSFLGFEANAWTAWGTTAAGILVLVGAAQHALAKLMSLITGVGLAAAAIIAAIDGDVLGLAAANTWTILGWAIASGILLVTALLPRVTREREVMAPASFADAPAPESIATTRPAEPVATPAGAGPATAVRSEPLRRTYQEPARSGQPTDAELAAAERAQAEQRARR